MSYDFKGNNEALVSSINALLALDAKGALAPHGIGEMARQLLEASASRLTEQHQGEPVCWVNDQQLLLCSKSPRVDEPDNPMMHNLPRNIAGSALQDEYCNTPLFRNVDTAEVVALRGAYLRAGEREHELRTQLAERNALLRDALESHGVMLMSDPPQDPWKTRRIAERINSALSERESPSEPDELTDLATWKRRAIEAESKLRTYDPQVVELGERAMQALLAEPKPNELVLTKCRLCDQLQADLTARDEQIDALSMDAGRYRWLRSRDLEAISQGGVFAGLTPDNLVLNEETLDQAIDDAMAPDYVEASTHGRLNGVPASPCAGCGAPGYTGNCDKCVPY